MIAELYAFDYNKKVYVKFKEYDFAEEPLPAVIQYQGNIYLRQEETNRYRPTIIRIITDRSYPL